MTVKAAEMPQFEAGTATDPSDPESREHQPARSVSAFSLAFSMPVVVWQALFFLLPLAFLLVLTLWTVQSFRLIPDLSAANWARVYGTGFFWDAYLRTFALATSSAVLVSTIAFPLTYCIAFHLSANAQRLAVLLLVTPFFTSYLVRVYTWQAFLADEGLINSALAILGLGPLTMLNNVGGIFIGYATLCLPLVVLLQLMSMANVDRSLVEAAHNLCCSPLRTVFAVVIPASRVGLVLGALFCFILTFGDFVSPTYLGGGNPPTLGILITDFTKAGNQWPRAAVVAVTMVITLLVIAFAAVRFAYKTRRSAL
ncbi:MAG: ABC transporter permease [Phyllobacteriaceae bacterium]|jgi:spermidine/putrescine transport system permease protein/putrescine transport system permease protein|nr:ABC transporter permease [Phyllobacteriaceae bacterium]